MDLKFISEHKKELEKSCHQRNLCVDIKLIEELIKKRSIFLQEIEEMRSKINQISQKIKKEGQKNNQKIISQAQELKKKLKEKENLQKENNQSLEEEVKKLPNLISPQTPKGKNEEDNRELEKIGEIPNFEFKVQDHLEIGEKLDIIDFKGGAKTTGSKFYFLKNDGLLLDLALTQLALDVIKKENFDLFLTPDLAKIDIIEKLGYNPRGPETQIYKIKDSDLGLIGTSEITLGGLFADRIIEAKELPIKIGGFSHCFRTEAGAYGKVSKGLYRVHQFNKVEMFIISQPDQSEKMLDLLVNIEKKIFKALEIPFRVIDCCSQDLGAPAYRKLDIEAWLPGEKKWGELTSASNCTDFQSQRLNIKFKNKKQTRFVHTLNATAIATPRVIIAILENFQQKDGSVLIPQVLQKWMNKKKITLS
ncbi:serine--tRNA ligase [Patescibacteria group bacterium]|nr:serine--tRNA ligase [Patescibacteria group bacterium]